MKLMRKSLPCSNVNSKMKPDSMNMCFEFVVGSLPCFQDFLQVIWFSFYDNIQRTKNQLCDCLCVVSQV